MKLRLHRIAPGFYETDDGKFEVFRTEWGEWAWNKVGRPPDDIYPTKGDAVFALQEQIKKR